MNRRAVICGLGSFLAGLPSLAYGELFQGRNAFRARAWKKIPSITAVAEENDFRTQYVHEAVGYWNGQFGRMGSRFRLGSVTQIIGMLPLEDLRAFWEKPLSLTASDLPESVRQVDGDVIVALSDGEFRPFTYRTPAAAKALIAIPTLALPDAERYGTLAARVALARLASHMIAHELGHVIGLGHNSDAATLMCGVPASCRHPWEIASDGFLPLTVGEWALLLEMYPRHWRADPPSGS
jgi:hypothetical protein